MARASLRWTVPVAAGLVAAGCPAFTAMGPARTLAPGTSQRWVSVGVYRTTLVTGTPPEPVERDVVWLPLVEAGARFGLSEGMDLGLRAGTGGASGALRVRIHQAATEESGLDLLFEPSVGWTALVGGDRETRISGAFVGFALPLGLNLGGGHQLVLAPRVAWVHDRVIGTAELAGGSAGLVLRVGGTALRPWYVVPECGLAAVSGEGRTFEGPVLQCALGLLGPW